MADYLSILAGMTISKIRRPKQSGIRRPICNKTYVAIRRCTGPAVRITMEDTLAEYRANLRIEKAEIAAHSSAPFLQVAEMFNKFLHLYSSR